MDFLGRMVDIGDYIAYARNPYATMLIGKVVGYTEKGFKVVKRKHDGSWGNDTWTRKSYEVVFPYQCVLVGKEEPTN